MKTMITRMFAQLILTKRRRSLAALLSIAVVASLCLESLLAPELQLGGDDQIILDEEGGDANDDASQVDQFHRYLLSSDFYDGGYIPETDYNAAAAATGDEDNQNQQQQPTNNNISAKAQQQQQPLPSYTIEDTLLESKIFEYTFAIIVYDPPTDKFIGLYSKDHKWKAGNKKLWKAMKSLVYMLRRTFPERFTPESNELVLAIGSGDYPHVRKDKLPHVDGKAPVLMFGSSFRDTSIYPNMMAMPMPEPRHLFCFVEWVEYGRVCKELSVEGKSLVYGDEENGLVWDNLIPQLIWRGTDFGFLPTLQLRPSLVHPDSRTMVRVPGRKDKAADRRRADAIHALNDKYKTLLPRWKGVALTAAAELELEESSQEQDKKEGEGQLPWVDIKFSSFLSAGKSPTVGSPKYAAWESVGIATAHGMSPQELAKYKYHIDLGGGGGTTWSGTIEKLAMPGLLFHHVTPTKDYIHDHLVPWKHYIPVTSDLRDLKDKFDWAESHPTQAKRIAQAGTDFMKELGTDIGFQHMFNEDFVVPMKRVIDAYVPVSISHPDKKSWQEVLHSLGDEVCRVLPVMECTGLSSSAYNACQLVGGDDVKKWANGGMYYRGS